MRGREEERGRARETHSLVLFFSTRSKWLAWLSTLVVTTRKVGMELHCFYSQGDHSWCIREEWKKFLLFPWPLLVYG